MMANTRKETGRTVATRNANLDCNSTPSVGLLLARAMPKVAGVILESGASISSLSAVLPTTAAVLLGRVSS